MTDTELSLPTSPTHEVELEEEKSRMLHIEEEPPNIEKWEPRQSSVFPIQYRTISFNVSNTKVFAAPTEVTETSKENKDDVTQTFLDMDWHKLSIPEAVSKLASSLGGLTSDQASRKLAEFGPNEPSKASSSFLVRVFWYWFSGFGTLLFVGAILVFLAWRLGQPPAVANLALAIALTCVFLLQGSFNAWQYFTTNRVMSTITGMLPENCVVLRDGSKLSIPARDIVPGDILFFKAGSKLPADVRFVEVTSDAQFDRSILTGESLSVPAVVDSTDDNYLETRCIGLQGTHCTQGSGTSVVVTTGDRTVFGRIVKLTNTPTGDRTPLQKEILNFVLIIVSAMILMNVIVVIMWGTYIRKEYPNYISVPTLIVDMVSIGIAFLPVGLPIALTASLTITANVMRKNKILCKSLKTVESLGAVSICLCDKTGTLTKNQMTATTCLIGHSICDAKELQLKCANDTEDKRVAVDQIRAVATLCNAADFSCGQMHLPLEERKIIGDATDQAIFRFAEGVSVGKEEVRELWTTRFDLPFNSKNKFAIRILSAAEENHLSAEIALSPTEATQYNPTQDLLLTIKGGPDVLLGRCSQYVGEDGECYGLDESMRTFIEETKDRFSLEGKRVILLARKRLAFELIRSDPSDGSFEQEALFHAQEGLTLVGLIGIVDPPREEVPEVVKTLRRAGIRVMMVTGDFKLTALAIARACGIVSSDFQNVHTIADLPRTLPLGCKDIPTPTNDSLVISGPELVTLNEIQWQCLMAYPEVVFARTTPEQKLHIVKSYKSQSHIVAMTGDGVNDAPSLKEAQVGIAPGTGSDIAIEAADMVLLESFSAITQAVLYGRAVFENLKKTIAYLLPAGSFAEFWPIMTNVIFGLPQILSSFLMVVICCFTDCVAATALTYEKPEADLMLQKPRNPKKDRLVDWKLLVQVYAFVGVIETVCSFAMAYWYAERQGVKFSSLWFSFGTTVPPPGMTSNDVQHVLDTASSVYFVNLVVMQWFNLMALRTRRLSIFQHPPLWNKKTQNLLLFPSILFALVVTLIFCYVPSIQVAIASTAVPVEYWFLPMAYGVGLVALEELRKACVTKYPNSWVAKAAW